MKPTVDLAKALRIISRAWGKQRGYVFFPHIDRAEQVRTGQRRAGYHENRAFKWPQEKAAILKHMEEHVGYDLYWCPSIFEGPDRQIELGMDEYALWADLDEADPKLLKSNNDFKPTVAWESSPGRYQALWLGNPDIGGFQGASAAGGENQRLSYFLEADKSGWDTTQLLRIPGWPNHKPEYAKNGKPAIGKLLWERGPMYELDDFKALPEVKGAVTADQLGSIIESEIDGVDRHKVIDRVKLKLNQRARELLLARDASGPQGSRGDNLWYLIRCLADTGCTIQEIVAVARGTIWNKFEGRSDELKRLITEAAKAIEQRSSETTEAIEEELAPKPKPTRLAVALKNVKPPEWLVEGIATEGSCGFIAGQPKSFKSWTALDLALSVSTGSLFLDYFRVLKPGPVLVIQEEDPLTVVRDRARKIWRGKSRDKMKLHTDGTVLWEPGNPQEFDPDIDIYCMEGFTASEGHWHEWLDETLAAGMDGNPYRLVIIDTLMNTAGDVEENKSQQMTSRIYKPMKLLMRKHNAALRFVHHMGKGGADDQRRGGQRMLGGTANHAWSEDSIYLTRDPRDPGKVRLDFESKSAPEKTYLISGLDNKGWTPYFEPEAKPREQEVVPTSRGRRSKDSTPKAERSKPGEPIIDLLKQGGSWSTNDLATELGRGYHPAYRSLRDLETKGLIRRDGKRWTLQ